MPTTTWIVAADRSRARIFEITDAERRLREIEELSHPRGRARNGELISDADGRFSARFAGPGGDSGGQRVTPVEHEAERFSKTLARHLDKARNRRRYDKLYLIAPPEFLGLMREHLCKEVRKLTAEEINKDLSWFDARAIERYVKPLRKPAWARPVNGRARKRQESAASRPAPSGRRNGGGSARAT